MILNSMILMSLTYAVIGYLSHHYKHSGPKAPGTGPAPRLNMAGRDLPDLWEIAPLSRSRNQKAGGELSFPLWIFVLEKDNHQLSLVLTIISR